MEKTCRNFDHPERRQGEVFICNSGGNLKLGWESGRLGDQASLAEGVGYRPLFVLKTEVAEVIEKGPCHTVYESLLGVYEFDAGESDDGIKGT